MKTCTAAMLFVAVLAMPARARIGETVDQIEARFGSGISTNGAQVVYLHAPTGLKIQADFVGGKCGQIRYNASTGQDLSKGAVFKLLQSNGWTQPIQDNLATDKWGRHSFWRQDRLASASWDPNENWVLVYFDSFWKAKGAQQAAALKDF